MKQDGDNFCELCHHSVQNMETHIGAEEHKRKLRRLNGEISRTGRYLVGPRMTGESLNDRRSDEASFPGRCVSPFKARRGI